MGAWPTVQRAHRRSAGALAHGVHRIVAIVGDHALPADTVLKHRFDVSPVLVDPRAIRHSLRVNAWRRSPEAQRGPLRRLRAWLRHGGAWKSSHLHLSRNVQGRFLIDDDLDLLAVPFQPRPVFEQLFVEGRAVQETDEYRYLAQAVREGHYAKAHGCRSLADVDRYLAELTDVYRSVAATGYRPQQALGGSVGDEIRVVVGRDGALAILGGGTHRLTIAQHLAIDRVPVVVRAVHVSWAGIERGDSRRCRIDKASSAIAALGHPPFSLDQL
jgi:hypothetical protein